VLRRVLALTAAIWHAGTAGQSVPGFAREQRDNLSLMPELQLQIFNPAGVIVFRSR
jgi:hypothetical protein